MISSNEKNTLETTKSMFRGSSGTTTTTTTTTSNNDNNNNDNRNGDEDRELQVLPPSLPPSEYTFTLPPSPDYGEFTFPPFPPSPEMILPEPTTNTQPEPVIMTNNVIKLGVRPTGSLFAPGTVESLPRNRKNDSTDLLPFIEDTTKWVGIRYVLPNGIGESEGAAWGSQYNEGWGVYANGDKASSSHSFGDVNLVSTTFNVTEKSSNNNDDGNDDGNDNDVTTTTTTEPTKIVRSGISTVSMQGGKLRIIHDFHPLSSSVDTTTVPTTTTPPAEKNNNLYEITITLENISDSDISDIRYRRSIDFNVSPTPFAECMTIQPNPNDVQYLKESSNSPIYHYDITEPTTNFPGIKSAPIENDGPYDGGATFDFSFDTLPAGRSRTFHMYYGATSYQNEAKYLLQSIRAEVYALAKPSNHNGQCTDEDNGQPPNVFIIAFKDVGGTPVTFQY